MKHRILQSLVIHLLTAAWLAVPVIAAEADMSFEAVKARAEDGDAYARTLLGYMYEYGNGTTKRDIEAIKWYRLAAEQGYPEAQRRLGVMHEAGKGVSQNNAEALRWFRLAAVQGDAFAQSKLSDFYEKGIAIPQNRMRAYVWASLAAAQGFTFADINRDLLANLLTPEQLAKGQELAARCFESGYKDCD